MRSTQTTVGTAPLDLIEDAIHWLRRTPATAHLAYLLGTVPFLLAFLWFWSDMSRGAFADRRCGRSAFLVAGLYLWMKSWHAVYCAELRARMAAEPSAPWTIRRWFDLYLVQASLQPWGLLAFPLSFVPLMLPVPWVFAFFRNIDVLADENRGHATATLRAAFREAQRWPGQNHGLIGLLLVAATVVLINIAIVLATLPSLVKMLTGLESDYTLSASAMIFNTTYLLAVGAITYLVLAPVILAVYTRRTFEGTALQTGADLRAQLRRLNPIRTAPIAKFWVFLALFAGLGNPFQPATSAEMPVRIVASSDPGPGVARSLEQTIRDVMERPDFTWRERREFTKPDPTIETDDPQASGWQRLTRWLNRQLKAVGTALEATLQALGRELQAILKWLFNGQRATTVPQRTPGTDQVDWISGLKLVLYGTIAAAVLTLVWQSARLWQRRRIKPAGFAPAAPALTTPDITADLVSPTALPEDDWLALARELAAKGDYRLAVRAVYLGELAHLAQREWVRLATAKSNRDYQREVARRTLAQPHLNEAFAATVAVFDRVWYGQHAATAETLADTEARFAELRGAT